MTDEKIMNVDSEVFRALAQDYLGEKKRKRRWGIFFKVVWALLFLMLVVSLYPRGSSISDYRKKPHAALIDLRGAIFDGSAANADNIAKALHKAYKDKGTVGVILRINSPGGSPVQADYMFNEIMRLKKKHPKIKVYAVCSDLCASAAYYVASAADKIYANPSSIVGSIGVLYNGFGFTGVMEKVGIQRRLLTAGQRKGFLDPFSPEKPEDVTYIKKILNSIHLRFEHQVEKVAVSV